MAEKRPTETEKAGNPEKPETIEVLLQEQLETDADLQPERDYQKFLEERERNAPAHGGTWSLFRSRREVIVVPGFMASQLSDEMPRGHGLVWIDPLRPSAMADLRLAAFESLVPEVEANSAVKIVAHDPPTGLYTNLFYNLRWYDCGVEFHPVDWRKDLEVAAYGLVQRILENRRNSTKPLFLAAHSQGALVARRALQMLGPEAARRMVQHVLLLGPAKMPVPVVSRLQQETARFLEQPEMRKRIAADGGEPVGSTPAEAAAFLKAELARWGEVIRHAGVQPEG